MRSRITLTAALLVSAACTPSDAETDPRLKQLTVGITRDSMLRIIGDGSTDSLANVYRREAYLFNGVPLEIYFYHPGGLKEGQGPAAAESTLRPIIVHGIQVTGWGWAVFDSVARTNDIRVKVR